MHNPYYNESVVAQDVATGGHREAVGGLWNDLGNLQLAFLQSRGMVPANRLLDVGCGALRLGCKAVDFLDAGNYFGIDLSPSLIEAGYQSELSAEQRTRLPRSNLADTADFDLSFLEEPVDVAIAQSVFTHLPLNHIRRCLSRVAGKLRVGGVFYATAWLVPQDWPLDVAFRQPGDLNGTPIITHDLSDPYHYHLADFAHLASDLPMQLELVGDWGHPRGQPMLAFRRR